MQNIEDLLMKLSRLFGTLLMGLTLLLISIFLLVLVSRTVGSCFQKKHPDVTFYLSDFKSAAEMPRGVEPVKKPLSREAKLAERFVEKELLPGYRKAVDAYLAKEKAAEDPAKVAEARKLAVEAFTAGSRASMERTLQGIDEKQQDAYVDGLADYIESAGKAGLEVLTVRGIPLSSFAQSGLWTKFHRDFNEQLAEIKKKQGDSDSMTALAGSAAIYAALFMLVLCFLLLGVLFSIMRIEQKMGGRM